MRDRTPLPAGPAPDATSLRQAALTHLSRFATTESGLVRVLDRRVDRWARRARDEGMEPGPMIVEARAMVRQVARALAASGVVDDRTYAASRARSLGRSGRSRQAVAADLAAKGVARDVARESLPDDAAERAAAARYARRRRLGPFRSPRDPALHAKDLGALARAGFAQSVAEDILRLDPGAAQNIIDAASRHA